MIRQLYLIILLVFLHSQLHAQTFADVEKVKTKLYNLSLESSSVDDADANNSIPSLLKKIEASGKWIDINYQNKSAAKWQPAQHWERLLKMAISYKKQSSGYYENKELQNAIINGINYWLRQTPIASNYWYNAIGVPNIMGKVYLLMEKQLADSTKAGGVKLMMLGVKPDHYHYYGVATGQNLLWLASAHLYASCLTNDVEGLERVFAAVADEIKITEDEGIQPDFSFYQHGKQNYALGYGKGFTETVVQYFFLANQTAFQFPQNKLDIVSHYILDGQQWMTRYDYLEYSAMGREISRSIIDRMPILKALKWMMDIDSLHRNQYSSFYKRLSGNKNEKPLIGNRYFYRSDLMVHQRKNYYFSLKAASNRITSSETGNGENLKGFYQGNGTYYLIRNGKEYKDVFPVWDWRKLPGLLTQQTNDTFPLITWGVGAEGATSFVYGISDSLYGCFGYDYNKQGVTAHRSWFFFDDEIVHLAAGVNGNNVYQSINQSIAKGSIWSSSFTKNNPAKVEMAFYDSIGYCINSNGYKVDVEVNKLKGSWHSINVSGSNETITKNVFSLGINLGAKAIDAAFDYTIVPAISLPQFKQYKLQDHIVILQNKKEVQAVYQKDIQQVQAVFFVANQIALPWQNLVLKMKQKGLVLVKKIGNKLMVDYCQSEIKKQAEIALETKPLLQNDEIEILNYQP